MHVPRGGARRHESNQKRIDAPGAQLMTEHNASAFSALSSDILVTDYTPSGRHSSGPLNCDFGGNTRTQKIP